METLSIKRILTSEQQATTPLKITSSGLNNSKLQLVKVFNAKNQNMTNKVSILPIKCPYWVLQPKKQSKESFSELRLSILL